jgi:rhodanese-related sulfurtransferase
MNKKMLSVLLMGVLVLVFSATAFAAEKMMEKDKEVMMAADKVLKMAPDQGFFRVDVKDVKMKMDSGTMDYVILDVRPANLFQPEHIPGAINIPLPTLVDNLKMLPMDKTIYVVCALDSNSSYATFTLRMLGYMAFMVPGGEMAWKQAGYPVESGTMQPMKPPMQPRSGY